MLALIQGRLADEIAVVLGNGVESRLRLMDHYFYYRSVRDAFYGYQDAFRADHRPDPEKYRSFGKWSSEAEKIMIAQDALIQVAGLNINQAINLKAA
jgi:uncharacterized protein